MPDESQVHDREIVDKAVLSLMTHFDAVQIFVTRHEAGSTMGYASGGGNCYSRTGMVEEWLSIPVITRTPDSSEGDDD